MKVIMDELEEIKEEDEKDENYNIENPSKQFLE